MMSDEKTEGNNSSSSTIRLVAEEVVTYARDDVSADKIWSLLSKLDDVNESIMKNVDDKFEFSIWNRTYTFTAISDHPYFTILHLQFFLWLMFGFQKEPTAAMNLIFAMASCGGDIGLPMCGIKFERDSKAPDRIIDGLPWDVYQNYNTKAKSWVNTNMNTIRILEEMFKKQNPFFLESSHPLPPFMKELLFKEVYSDVKIFCEKDGTTYPAHQTILSSSSPYFQQYFTGPWSTEGGEYYKTEVDSDIMKYLLTFVYTNSFGTSLVGMSIDTLLKIRETARFFQMDNLVDCCTCAIYGCKTDFLLSTITIETIKDIIRAAHITRPPCPSSSSSRQQQASDGGGDEGSDSPYQALVMRTNWFRYETTILCTDANKRLWTRCAEFFCSNSIVLVFDTNFMSLRDEYPEIWKHLQDEVSKLKQNMDTSS